MTNVIIETNKTETEPTYKFGDLFLVGGILHLLAQVNGWEYSLASLVTGDRYENPISVVNSYEITEQEVTMMYGGDTFIPVKSVKISYEL